MSVTDGIGQTPCSLEHYLVLEINCIKLYITDLTNE